MIAHAGRPRGRRRLRAGCRASCCGGIVTNDIAVDDGQVAMFAGLLSPQGKVLFEFLVVRGADGFLLDVARDRAGELGQAADDVQAAGEGDDRRRVGALAGAGPLGRGGVRAAAGRHDLVHRSAPGSARQSRASASAAGAAGGRGASSSSDASPADDYHAHRIELGIPEGGKDYDFGDAFPHEANFDLNNGVSFTKGCYVGQEIVARMEHRTVVRKRVVRVSVRAGATLSAARPEVVMGEVVIGRVGSVAGRHGLAMLRLDRAMEAIEQGVPITAGGLALEVDPDAIARYHAQSIERKGQCMSPREVDPLPVGRRRCREYQRYHDEEWGVPMTDDRRMLEKLVLEGFQSGLSWLTILRKRENFRRAFHDFDAAKIARYGDKDKARLMADAGIVRNRLKIEATIDNAQGLPRAGRAAEPGIVPVGLPRWAPGRASARLDEGGAGARPTCPSASRRR